MRRALERLRTACTTRGIASRTGESLSTLAATDEVVVIARPGSSLALPILGNARMTVPDVPEALALVRGELESRPAVLLSGSDVRGLVYALLEVADHLTHAAEPGTAFDSLDQAVERPANPIRSVARYFTSEVEDKPWFYDRSFWTAYLSMLVAQRFNRFSPALGLGYNAPRSVRVIFPHLQTRYRLPVPPNALPMSGRRNRSARSAC